MIENFPYARFYDFVIISFSLNTNCLLLSSFEIVLILLRFTFTTKVTGSQASSSCETRKDKEIKMTRRYLHPANGQRRNGGVGEQILLYPLSQFIQNSVYSPFQRHKSRGKSKNGAIWIFKRFANHSA